MEDKKCQDCVFSDYYCTIESEKTYMCRKNPPISTEKILIRSKNFHIGIFPKVMSDDWCGDYKKNIGNENGK